MKPSYTQPVLPRTASHDNPAWAAILFKLRKGRGNEARRLLSMPAVLRRLFGDGSTIAIEILRRPHVHRALRNMPNWNHVARAGA